MKIQPLFLALSVALLAPTGCDEEMSEKLETLDSAQDPADDLAAEDEDEDEESEPESAVEISEIDEFTAENDPSASVVCTATCGAHTVAQYASNLSFGKTFCMLWALEGCTNCKCGDIGNAN